MNLRAYITPCLLVSLIHSAPIKVPPITALPEELVVYTAEFDIVNIIIPINKVQLIDNDNKNNVSADKRSPLIFFVLADNTTDQIVYKGLYARKNNEVKKILDNGRDATATATLDDAAVYFAASDGIYSYNAEKNIAEKYGTVTDNIISISKCNGTDTLYILTADHLVYKVTNGGTQQEEIPEVENPQQFVMDYNNNLYFANSNGVHIFGPNGVKKIEGLPSKIDYIKLIRSPVALSDGIPVVVDNKLYRVFSNATSSVVAVDVIIRPTAYSVEGTVFLYFGYNKKLYEFNLIKIILDALALKFKNK